MINKIFEELLADNSRLAKEAILRRELNNDLLKQVIFQALNPYIRFHVRKIPIYGENTDEMTLETAVRKLDVLSSRQLTGHNAIDYLRELFTKLSADDAKVLVKIIEKDLKCGVSISTVNKIWPGLIPEFELQLCAGYDPKKVSKRFAVEPKIDGMRVFAMNEGGIFTFMTRGGRALETLDHLVQDLNGLMENAVDYNLDCEVVSGGSLEETVSAVKRDGKAKGQVKLVVFDHVTREEFESKKSTRTYEERRAFLLEKFTPYCFYDKPRPVVLNDSDVWDGEGEPVAFISEVFAQHRLDGIEGTIVKDLDGLYEFDRTTAWMKVKPFEHQDVVITGYYPGKKGTRNEHRLGGFTFMYDGVESRVGGGYSDKQRDEFWEIRDEMIGVTIEVEFMEKTKKGATRHCNFIIVRSYKGERF